MRRSDGAEGHEHGKVDGDCVVEEGPYDLLHEFDLRFGQGRVGIGRRGELLLFAVDGFVPFVRGMASAEREEGRKRSD